MGASIPGQAAAAADPGRPGRSPHRRDSQPSSPRSSLISGRRPHTGWSGSSTRCGHPSRRCARSVSASRRIVADARVVGMRPERNPVVVRFDRRSGRRSLRGGRQPVEGRREQPCEDEVACVSADRSIITAGPDPGRASPPRGQPRAGRSAASTSKPPGSWATGEGAPPPHRIVRNVGDDLGDGLEVALAGNRSTCLSVSHHRPTRAISWWRSGRSWTAPTCCHTLYVHQLLNVRGISNALSMTVRRRPHSLITKLETVRVSPIRCASRSWPDNTQYYTGRSRSSPSPWASHRPSSTTT